MEVAGEKEDRKKKKQIVKGEGEMVELSITKTRA